MEEVARMKNDNEFKRKMLRQQSISLNMDIRELSRFAARLFKERSTYRNGERGYWGDWRGW